MWIIPACAGKPGPPPAPGRRPRDYPRVCGEAARAFNVRCPHLGLSPRVRGSLHFHREDSAGKGIIPACAGKPYGVCSMFRASRDYPRVCGEARLDSMLVPIHTGLSPRVRGSRRSRNAAEPRHGIIPACAGKPPPFSMSPARAWDYPRVCGEAASIFHVAGASLGLSPRVRGSRWPPRSRRTAAGIIPACAGKPPPFSMSPARAWDYPRVCGEAVGHLDLVVLPQGLSPRVRGSQSRRHRPGAAGRIIPACAGKPRRCNRKLRAGRDYPRVCGEA